MSTIEILGDAVGDVDWMSNMSIVDPVLWTFQNLAGLATPSCLPGPVTNQLPPIPTKLKTNLIV